jgi:hypothetical protein
MRISVAGLLCAAVLMSAGIGWAGDGDDPNPANAWHQDTTTGPDCLVVDRGEKRDCIFGLSSGDVPNLDGSSALVKIRSSGGATICSTWNGDTVFPVSESIVGEVRKALVATNQGTGSSLVFGSPTDLFSGACVKVHYGDDIWLTWDWSLPSSGTMFFHITPN